MDVRPGAVDIAVGVLRGAQGHLLIAQRRPGTRWAGYWEFPGGKQEAGETIQTTLARELQEELGVTPRTPRRLIRMHNERVAQAPRLHVWLVTDWQGVPRGREGQRVVWCPEAELSDYALLPGNRVIINALRLPDRLAITPDVGTRGRAGWLESLQATMNRGISLLRLRAPGLDDASYEALAAQVLVRARAAAVQVLLDRTPEMVQALGAAGLHWSAKRAVRAGARPLCDAHWFAVSAHCAAELQTAVRLDADFATLSPLRTTASHPRRQPLGWSGWQRLRADLGLPVYALGGLTGQDVATARARNAQGVAAIRAFWGRETADYTDWRRF